MNTKDFTGHTPGPWHVTDPDDDGDFFAVCGGKGHYPNNTLFTNSLGTWRSPFVDAANMFLAAAAPEVLRQRDMLLATLKEINLHIRSCNDEWWHRRAEQLVLHAIAECDEEVG